MNWIDFVVIAILAWMTFRAFTVGLVRELVTLAAVVAGLVLAGAFYGDLSANLEFAIADETTRNLLSFGSIMAGTVVIGQVAGTLLRQFASLLALGPFDRLGGAAFGFVKGLLIVQAALLALAVFPAAEGISTAVADSTVARFFLEDAPVATVGLPAEFTDARAQLMEWQRSFGVALPSQDTP